MWVCVDMKHTPNEWEEIESSFRAGLVLTPLGDWIAPPLRLPSKVRNDVWCEADYALRKPSLEWYLAMYMECMVATGQCGASGESRFDFVKAQVKEHCGGDRFDAGQLYIDGYALLAVEELGRPRFETIEDAFGGSPRREMNRLKHRAEHPRRNRLPDTAMGRMTWLTLAMKIWFARAGYPEFCEPFWP